jgi:hypothetical protein
VSGGKGRSIVNQSFSATVSIIQGNKKGQFGLDFRYAAVTDDQSQVTKVTNPAMTFANTTILGGCAASLVHEHAPEMERGETCLIRKSRNARRLHRASLSTKRVRDHHRRYRTELSTGQPYRVGEDSDWVGSATDSSNQGQVIPQQTYQPKRTENLIFN